LVGEAYIWRPEGSSTARPSRPVPASSWLVAATVIPAEDSTREPRYSCHIYHPAPCGPGFLVHGAAQDRGRDRVWPPSEKPVQGRFPSLADNRNLKLSSQLNELYRSASTVHRAGDNHTGCPLSSVPGRTTVMSVAAKSSPVHSTGCPVRSASAYVKQSPKLSPAGCRPLPYRRQPLIARSARSASTGTVRSRFEPGALALRNSPQSAPTLTRQGQGTDVHPWRQRTPRP
jgi:hypothetical protein